jgi:hypothetical protein
MHPETPPEDADAGLRDRFAALFERFAAGEGGRSNSADAAHLLDQLAVMPGARILCCDQSVTTFGWALTAAGCSITLLSREDRAEASDGAVCSAEELARRLFAPSSRTVALLSSRMRTGARLVVTGTSGPWGSSPPLPSSTFGHLGLSLSSAGESLSVWVRIGSE